MKKLAAALATVLVLAAPASAWTGGPTSERELDQRIQTLHKRKDKHKDAIKSLKERIERKRERLDVLSHKVRIFTVQDGWVATLVRLRECESHSNYQEGPDEGVPGHDGAYQYDAATWGNAWGYARSYLAPWYYQDARTAQYLANGEEERWACY